MFLDDLFFPQLLLAPDDGGGTGGAVADPVVDDEDGEGENTPPKEFTKQDMEAAVNKRVRKMTKELTALQQSNADLAAKMEALSKVPTGTGEPDGTDPETKKLTGQFEIQKKHFEYQIQDLTTKLKTAEDSLVKESTTRRNMQRDVAVTRALEKIGCIDTEVGNKIFSDRAEYDEDDDTWYLKMRSGTLTPIEEGIASDLPDYLRPASMRGGSGSSGGSTKANATKRKLDVALEELKVVSEKLKRAPGDDTLVTEFRRKTRTVNDLKKQANAS